MKASRLSCLLFGSALLLALPVFAGSTIKKSLQINETISVQGVKLAPGNYKVEWSEPGPTVQVSILRGKDVLATVPATMVPERSSNEQDGYGVKPGANGGQSLAELFFSGEKYQLEIGASSNGSAHAGGSGNFR